jgi:hypothetical protein
MMIDPFHGDTDAANEAYIIAGKVAIWWGPVELAIELIILMLRNRQKAPVRDHAFIDFPVSFAKKANEIKDRLKVDDALFGNIRPRVSALLGDATSIHKRRTIVCHSRCQGFSVNGHLHFMRSDQKRGVSGTSEYIAPKQLEADVKRMWSLADDFEKIALDIRARGIGLGAPPFAPANPL